jgi:hypothetical protein
MIVNSELVVASLSYYPSIYLEELRKAMKNVRIIISQPRSKNEAFVE